MTFYQRSSLHSYAAAWLCTASKKRKTTYLRSSQTCLWRCESSGYYGVSEGPLHPAGERIRASETSVTIYQSTWGNIPEGLNIQQKTCLALWRAIYNRCRLNYADSCFVVKRCRVHSCPETAGDPDRGSCGANHCLVPSAGRCRNTRLRTLNATPFSIRHPLFML